MDSVLDLFHQHSRRLATLANVVLVVLMSVAIANSVLFVINNMGDETITSATKSHENTTSSNASTVNLSALNLFGKAAEKAAPVNIDAPETSLNLELQGVFTAPDAEDSTAIVAERGKSGELYQIGDRLPGNAELAAVFDDYILIKRGGRTEKLMFSDAPIRKQFGKTPSASVPSRIGPGLTASPAAPGNRLQEIRNRIAARTQEINRRRQQQAQSPGATIRDYVDKYKNEIKSNPKGVLNQLGVNPVSDSKASGYRITGNIPQQMLTQAGLQEGDVILSVNGNAVGNAANDSGLVDQVMAAGRARVEVQRGTRKFFLTVPIP